MSAGTRLVLLTAAVVDEFLQQFVGRTSSVGDAVVDFAGALAGIVVVMIVGWWVSRGLGARVDNWGIPREGQ